MLCKLIAFYNDWKKCKVEVQNLETGSIFYNTVYCSCLDESLETYILIHRNALLDLVVEGTGENAVIKSAKAMNEEVG